MTHYILSMTPKTEARRKREAKERAERAFRKTLKNFGLGGPGPLRGAISSLVAAQGKRRDLNSQLATNVRPHPGIGVNVAEEHRRGVSKSTFAAME